MNIFGRHSSLTLALYVPCIQMVFLTPFLVVNVRVMKAYCIISSCQCQSNATVGRDTGLSHNHIRARLENLFMAASRPTSNRGSLGSWLVLISGLTVLAAYCQPLWWWIVEGEEGGGGSVLGRRCSNRQSRVYLVPLGSTAVKQKLTFSVFLAMGRPYFSSLSLPLGVGGRPRVRFLEK